MHNSQQENAGSKQFPADMDPKAALTGKELIAITASLLLVSVIYLSLWQIDKNPAYDFIYDLGYTIGHFLSQIFV